MKGYTIILSTKLCKTIHSILKPNNPKENAIIINDNFFISLFSLTRLEPFQAQKPIKCK